MKSLVPLDANYVLKITSQVIPLINEYRTALDKKTLENYRTAYFASKEYKIRQFFKRPLTDKQIYDRCRKDTNWLFIVFPSDAYSETLNLAISLKNASVRAIQNNVNNMEATLLVNVGEFNVIDRALTKLVEWNDAQ